MVSIGIRKDLKDILLKMKDDDESMDQLVVRLLENSKDIEPYVENPRTNIKISENTFHRLKELKGPKESYGSVILRLLNSQ